MKKLGVFLAIAAILVGILLIGAVFFSVGFDFEELNTEKYERSKHLFGEEEFAQIEINTTFFDVKILPVKEGEEPYALLPASENIKHNVINQEGKLSISLADGRAWYEKWSFGNLSGECTVIEVYVPHKQYRELKVLASSGDISLMGRAGDTDLLSFEAANIKTNSGDIAFHARATGGVGLEASTGKIEVSGMDGASLGIKTSTGDISVQSCELISAWFTTATGEVMLSDLRVTGSKGMELFAEVDSGDLELRNVKANTIRVKADTGDVEMSDVLVTGEMRVETDTGEIDIKHSDAGSLYLETDTGDVEMELLTGKMYTVEADTGDVRHPDHDKNGGACVVKTETGDVRITVLSK